MTGVVTKTDTICTYNECDTFFLSGVVFGQRTRDPETSERRSVNGTSNTTFQSDSDSTKTNPCKVIGGYKVLISFVIPHRRSPTPNTLNGLGTKFKVWLVPYGTRSLCRRDTESKGHGEGGWENRV